LSKRVVAHLSILISFIFVFLACVHTLHLFTSFAYFLLFPHSLSPFAPHLSLIFHHLSGLYLCCSFLLLSHPLCGGAGSLPSLRDTTFGRARGDGGACFTSNCVTIHLSKHFLALQGREQEEWKRERATCRGTISGGLALVQPIYQNISLAPGPAEISFWTWFCPDFSFSSFLCIFLWGAPSNRNTYLSCLTAVPCLYFSLQTALRLQGLG